MNLVRASALAVCLSFVIPAVLAGDPGEADAEASVCPEGLRAMDGVGLVCPRGSLYEVFTPELRSLGFIHGVDPIPEPTPSEAADGPIGIQAGTSVNCVSGATGTYYIQVIYARAFDDADGYAANLNKIRWLVGQANKLVDDAAIATGGTASLNVKCAGGDVEVKNEVLPTAMASASFSTIVADLEAKGYTNGKVKHWVYYDDTSACTCGGTGHIYGDDTLAVTNLNNGNGAPLFAVTFGYNSTRIMLHELGHNMGAVQNGSPRSTLAGHCYDGLDTMCYNDGGPNGHLYATTYCPGTEVFDCGKNDYFNRNPASGSYLATKWNLGNSLNRFIFFGTPGAPVLTTLSCSPGTIEIGASTTCNFVATDDSSGVRYTINWGDSTSTTIPASGYVPPGVGQSASHSYTGTGTKSISVSVVDSTGLSGSPLATSVTVVSDPPSINLLTCSPNPVEISRTLTCNVRATDSSSGVRYTIDWGDSTSTTIPAAGFVTPGVIQTTTHSYAAAGSKTVTANVVDVYGNAGGAVSVTVTVTTDLTPPALTITDPTPGTVYVGCGTQRSVGTTPALWVDRGCIRATASDSGGVNRLEAFVSNVLVGVDTTPPYQFEFDAPGTGASFSVRVDAYDNAGNRASATRSVASVG